MEANPGGHPTSSTIVHFLAEGKFVFTCYAPLIGMKKKLPEILNLVIHGICLSIHLAL